jgi:DNA-binding NtrC family response regulator
VPALCCPPPEAMKGIVARAQRLVPGAQDQKRWIIDFFPLGAESGFFVLGRISVKAEAAPATHPPIPDNLLALRESRISRYSFDRFSSQLPAVTRAVNQARLASATSVPVLIQGEPGTGKEWLGRTIHYQSEWRDRPFMALDCRRVSPPACAEVIFAERSKAESPGKTLYLREPSFLPRDLQTTLCHEMEESEGTWRILAGSALDLDRETREGRLLETFHCVLGCLVIRLPPLRERTSDLPALVEQMLERCRGVVEQPVTELSEEAWKLLRTYPWPGNLRELYAVVRIASVRAGGSRIGVEHLPSSVKSGLRLDQSPPQAAERAISLDQILEQAERRLIILALKRAKGNKSQAAEWLSIWRPRLLRRMEALGVTDWAAD